MVEIYRPERRFKRSGSQEKKQMSNKKANPGDKVELAVKDGGFYDSQTNFKIVNDQKVSLGDVIGEKTNRALLSGGLLVVSSKGKSKKSKAGKSDKSNLPEDLPGRDVFVAEGLDLDAIKGLSDEQLNEIKGVGPKTIEDLKKYLA